MKDVVTVHVSEADARVLQRLADLTLHSVETCAVFNEWYRERFGNEVGYPPAPIKGSPSDAVARACSAIAIGLAGGLPRDPQPDAAPDPPRCPHPNHVTHKIGTCPLCGEYDDLPF